MKNFLFVVIFLFYNNTCLSQIDKPIQIKFNNDEEAYWGIPIEHDPASVYLDMQKHKKIVINHNKCHFEFKLEGQTLHFVYKHKKDKIKGMFKIPNYLISAYGATIDSENFNTILHPHQRYSPYRVGEWEYCINGKNYKKKYGTTYTEEALEDWDLEKKGYRWGF